MIFVVCGGRNFVDTAHMCTALDELQAQHPCTLLMTGGAAGAAFIADRWAEHRGIDRLVIPTNWERDGSAGGPIRNTRLAQLAHIIARVAQEDVRLIAFPGGQGTADMCRKARAMGIPVVEPMGESAPVS